MLTKTQEGYESKTKPLLVNEPCIITEKSSF